MYYVLESSTFVLCLIFSTAEVRSYEDFSDAETLLLRYYNYAGKLKWRWSVKAFCRIICPGTLRVEDEFTYVEENKLIMLESPDCTTIEVEMLTCGCNSTKSQRADEVQMFDWYSLVAGLNGEVYRVAPPERTRCDDEKTYVVHKEVVGGGYLAERRPLRLAGVGQIFEKLSQKGFNIRYTNGENGEDGSESENELDA